MQFVNICLEGLYAP